jgi:hypothetical protein
MYDPGCLKNAENWPCVTVFSTAYVTHVSNIH